MKIIQEEEKHFGSVYQLIKQAFSNVEISDHTEQDMVERLRKSEAFIPELSLIAEIEGKVVGHILLSKLKIKDGDKVFQSLALAPVSVLPAYQNQGIGSKLILHSHKVAKELSHESIVLIGHKAFYPRFGYQPAGDFGLSLPFEVPTQNFMVLELKPGVLEKIKGQIEYPKEFFE